MKCNLLKKIEDLEGNYDEVFRKLDDSLDPEYFLDLEKISDKEISNYVFKRGQNVDFLDTNSRKKRALDFIGSAFNWCCGVMTETKIKDFVMNEKNLATKIEELQTGLHESYQHLTSISSTFKDYDKDISDTFSKINEQLEKIHEEEDFSSNRFNTIQGQMTEIMMKMANNVKRSLMTTRLFRQSEILNACKLKTIPTALLTPGILATDLDRLEQQLRPLGLALAIPRKQLSQYYKLPIVDCALSNHKIVVHVKVPIKEKNRDWELVEILTVPFGWNNDTCIIVHDTMYLAVSGNQVRPISGAGLHQCKPYDNTLCYLPRFSSDAVYGPQCAFKMFQGATAKEITDHCAFRCHRSNQIVISEVESDTYVITHPNHGMFINCPTYKKEINSAHINQPGALQVQLPCNCSLIHDKKVLISARIPCGEDSTQLTIQHVLPVTWSTFTPFKIDPLKADRNPIYEDINNCLNHNWTEQVPHLNLSAISGTSRENAAIEKALKHLELKPDTFTTHRDYLLTFLWGLIILIVLRNTWKLNQLLRLVTPTVAFDQSQVQHAEELYIFLVILTAIVSVLVLSAIVYKVYMKLKFFIESRRDRSSEIARRRRSSEEVPLQNLGAGTLTLPGGNTFLVDLTRSKSIAVNEGRTSPEIVRRSLP